MAQRWEKHTLDSYSGNAEVTSKLNFIMKVRCNQIVGEEMFQPRKSNTS